MNRRGLQSLHRLHRLHRFLLLYLSRGYSVVVTHTQVSKG
jgi:hypothetical protein